METALVASGLVAEQYRFLGYLPRAEKARAALWEELGRWPYAAVAFESPKRLPATLASLAAVWPERPVAVCRELTKRFEEVVRGTAAEVAPRFGEPPKGEITLVIGESLWSKATRAKLVGALRARGSRRGRRQAADVVSRLTGVSRNRLYRGSL